MDRCALFVDAGYLVAAGGMAVCGTKKRGDIDCDYPALAGELSKWAVTECGFPVLRIYWYDAAPDGVPLPDHLAIAHLPEVKLRLGRLSGGSQKGVDSLIVRDLMTLARERAIATAYLLSGDEDLRVAVVAAQDMGVRVGLLGIPVGRQNQAPTLVREADEHIVLPKEFWSPHFQKKEEPAAKTSADTPAGTDENEIVGEAGTAFANEWADAAQPEEVLDLITQKPWLPKQLDVQLIRKAEERSGSLRDRQELKIELRKAFWVTLEGRRP